MDETRIATQIDGSVMRITLNRPQQLNALSVAMITSIAETVQTADKDPNIDLIVIDANGDRGFSAGGDVAEIGNEQQGEAILRLVAAFVECSTLTVSIIHGSCYGGALLMPGLSDIVLARADLKIRLPEIKFHTYPYIIHAVLAEKMPDALVWNLCATGRALDAKQARQAGLVSDILPSTDVFRDKAQAAVAEISTRARALQLGKEFHREALGVDFESRRSLAAEKMRKNRKLPGLNQIIEGYKAGLSKRAVPGKAF